MSEMTFCALKPYICQSLIKTVMEVGPIALLYLFTTTLLSLCIARHKLNKLRFVSHYYTCNRLKFRSVKFDQINMTFN